MNIYMKLAVEEALKGIKLHDGGPFGAVIVRNDVVISKGHNKVISTKDPTAHAEIVAIREASRILNSFDLSDCVLYTTCEPCPMCFSAIHWARIGTVYYGATRQDASQIGFDDAILYEMLAGNTDLYTINLQQMNSAECLHAFKIYDEDSEKTHY